MFEDILAEFISGKPRNIYFLTGEENWFLEELTDRAESDLIPQEQRDFNLQVIYGRDADVKAVTEACRQSSFMGGRKLVLYKEAQEGRNWEEILPYLSNPTSQTTLVIVFKNKKPDGRSSWVKAMKEKAVYFESKALPDHQVPGFIKSLAQKKKISIDTDGIKLMAEYIGNNLGQIDNELEKIRLVGGSAKNIGADIIAEYIGISREFNVFELCRVLSSRDRHAALRIMSNMSLNMKQGEMVPVISAIFNHFQKIWLCKLYGSKGDQELASIIKLSFASYLKEYRQGASQYSLKELQQVIGVLRDFDLRSKGYPSGNTPHPELLKELVVRIV